MTRARVLHRTDGSRASAAAKKASARASLERKNTAPRAARTAARAGASPIDTYLSALPADQRCALERLRGAIHAAAPGAEECISYGMPAFRLDGLVLVAFGAAKDHCSFFPMSGTTVEQHAEYLAAFDTSKGTIRFQPNHALPAVLVRKLVKARIAENAARR